MADFDNDWKITGTPDPATPDPQPHQVQTQAVFQAAPGSQPQAQPAFQPAPAAQPQAQSPFKPQPQAPVQAFQPQGGVRPVQSNQPVVIGYNVNGPVYRNSNGFVMPAQRADHTAEREANLNEIAKMINHFSPKVDVFQDYENCYKDILKYTKRSVAPFVWGILVILHSFIVFFVAFTSKYKNSIMIYSIIAIVVLLFGIGLIALYFIKKKRHRAKLEELYVRFQELSDQLKIVYNGYSNCALPSEYTDPRLLYQFQSMIYQGRVFSIGAALNSLLAAPGVYQRITDAKKEFELDTAEKFNGKACFFNAVRFFGIK